MQIQDLHFVIISCTVEKKSACKNAIEQILASFFLSSQECVRNMYI